MQLVNKGSLQAVCQGHSPLIASVFTNLHFSLHHLLRFIFYKDCGSANSCCFITRSGHDIIGFPTSAPVTFWAGTCLCVWGGTAVFVYILWSVQQHPGFCPLDASLILLLVTIKTLQVLPKVKYCLLALKNHCLT